MNGVRSLKRNLDTEDESYRRDSLLLDRERFSEDSDVNSLTSRLASSEREDEMDVMAARDVHLHHAPLPQQPPNNFSKLAGAALLASAIGIPTAAVAWKALDREPAPVFEDTDTVRGLQILKDE